MAAKCRVCSKAVYPMDPQINLDGVKFHKPCAKCADCGCQITVSNFTKNESSEQTILLCKIHYFKRFHEGGSYLGGEKFKVKADRDVKAQTATPGTSVSSSSSAPAETVFTGATTTAATADSPTVVEPAVPAPAVPEAAKEAEQPAPAVEPVPAAVATEETAATEDDDNAPDAAVEESAVSTSAKSDVTGASDDQDQAEQLELQEIPESDD